MIIVIVTSSRVLRNNTLPCERSIEQLPDENSRSFMVPKASQATKRYIYIYIYIQIHTHTYIHIYIYIYI